MTMVAAQLSVFLAQDTTSLTGTLSEPEDDMAKKVQKRAGARPL
jgi:hypothetical protein